MGSIFSSTTVSKCNPNELEKCFCSKYTTKSFIMESVHDLIVAGGRLGYKDDELKIYVSDHKTTA